MGPPGSNEGGDRAIDSSTPSFAETGNLLGGAAAAGGAIGFAKEAYDDFKEAYESHKANQENQNGGN